MRRFLVSTSKPVIDKEASGSTKSEVPAKPASPKKPRSPSPKKEKKENTPDESENNATGSPKKTKSRSPSPKKNTSEETKEISKKETTKKETIKKDSTKKENETIKPSISSIDTHSNSTVELNEGEIPADLQSFITWKKGEPIPYLAVVNTFEEISKVSGRIDKENLLSRLFSAILVTNPQELDAAVYISSSHIFPVYDGLELGVGDSILVKSICEATGRTKEGVEEAYEREGDLGVVAVQSRSSQKTLGFVSKPKPLQATYVLEQFRTIAQIKGEKAQARKLAIIKSLLVRGEGQEAKYIIRALQGKLRIGTAEQTVLVALAHTLLDYHKFLKFTHVSVSTNTIEDDNLIDSDNEDNMIKSQHKTRKNVLLDDSLTLPEKLQQLQDRETPEGEKLRLHFSKKQVLPKDKLYEQGEIVIKRAFSECPNLSILVDSALTTPLSQLYQVCKLKIGVPVAPMLAKPTKEISEVMRRLSGQAFTMEYKYDGERAQLHLLPNGSVKIFSRNSEDNTEKYPDLKDVIL